MPEPIADREALEERVAEAEYRADPEYSSVQWEWVVEPVKERFRVRARAALAVIEEVRGEAMNDEATKRYPTSDALRFAFLAGAAWQDGREEQPHPQDLLRELLQALGEFDGARSGTPKSIWDDAILKVRSLVATERDLSRERALRDSVMKGAGIPARTLGTSALKAVEEPDEPDDVVCPRCGWVM